MANRKHEQWLKNLHSAQERAAAGISDAPDENLGEEFDEEAPSRSQLKRESAAIQE